MTKCECFSAVNRSVGKRKEKEREEKFDLIWFEQTGIEWNRMELK